MVPKVKLSEDKATYPFRKQVFRQCDDDGRYRGDVIARADGELPGEPQLGLIMRSGELVGSPPELISIQQRTALNLARLPVKHKRLRRASPYPVRFSAGLEMALEAARKRAARP